MANPRFVFFATFALCLMIVGVVYSEEVETKEARVGSCFFTFFFVSPLHNANIF